MRSSAEAKELLDNFRPNPLKTCAGCTACCTSIPVPEIGLKAWQRCPHVRTPPERTVGCAIYARRPNACRMWQCGWRGSDWPDELRPDRCGVIVDPLPDVISANGEEVAVCRLWVFPGHEDDYRRDPVRMLILAVLHGGYGVLWDLPPGPDGQRLARFMRLGADGRVEVTVPTPSNAEAVAPEAERVWRAFDLVQARES